MNDTTPPPKSDAVIDGRGGFARDPSMFREILDAAPDAMVLVDPNGEILLANTQSEKLFGFSPGELAGQQIEVLLPSRLRDTHLAHRARFSEAPKIRAMGNGFELLGARKDGAEFPVEISLSPIRTTEGTLVLSAIRDTTKRRATEQKLRESLREKEVLLKEVHHRVKNNLQVISSLLNFQADQLTDPIARGAFQDTRSRIKSIALLHERLYQSEDLSHIDFEEYVTGLMNDLYDAYGADRSRVRLETEIERIALDVDTVVNCGLILNELASNALKYAFSHGESGAIRIALGESGDGISLRVSNDGAPLPPGDEFLSKPTLGLKLVRGLAKELRGTFAVRRDPRTEFEVRFPRRERRH